MIFLRIFSFVAGCFALSASPFLLLGEEAGLRTSPAPVVALAVLTVLLFSCIYFFFTLFGHRTARSPRLRYLAGGLVAFQLLAGAWLLSASDEPRALVGVAPLLCFTVFLFMAFVWPGDTGCSRRPMRRREPIDELQPY